MKSPFYFGMDSLPKQYGEMLRTQRIGLIAHAASVTKGRIPSADFLVERGFCIHALLSPEHGFSGKGDAGECIHHTTHSQLNIPIYSLYGDTRRPTREMLHDIDVLIFDLQDLGFRCYTYISTLRYVLEAASENNIPVIIADRPIPLPSTVDGPMLDIEQESFVGFIPSPLCYGMTPGEAALWLNEILNLSIDLHISPMMNYSRLPAHEQGDIPWTPPSPGIKSWVCAYAYLSTVFTEAFPEFDCSRNTDSAFQILQANFMDVKEVGAVLQSYQLPGINFLAEDKNLRLQISEPRDFLPVTTSLYLLHTLQQTCGKRIWMTANVRPEFFDQLYGSSSVREQLKSNVSPEKIVSSWKIPRASFLRVRNRFFLY